MRAASIGILLTVVLNGPVRAAPNSLGVNIHLPTVDVLDAAKDLGVGWVRIDFNWYLAQPQANKAPDFSVFDTVVDAARARGLEVYASIGYAPAWACDPDTDGVATNNVPKAGLYRVFTELAAKHFVGRISHWGLWNEPNLSGFFEGTMQQWIDRILKEGFAGIKAGCASCKVLGPELATVGSSAETWATESFRQLKQAGLMFDAITWHIYGSFIELDPTWACWDGDLFFHDLDEPRACFGVPVGGTPLLPILQKEQLTNVPVWITETGYRAPQGSADEAKQALYYRRVLEEQLARPWWTHTFFYEIVDDNNWNEKWGISTRKAGSGPFAFPADYQLKPAWALLKKAVAAQPAFGGSGVDCDDGLDNDLDGKVDFPADPQCTSLQGASEGVAPPKPDLGAPPVDAAAADQTTTATKDLGSSHDAGPDSAASDAAPDLAAAEAGSPKPSSSSSGCALGGHRANVGAPWGLLLLLACALVRRSRGRGRSGRRPRPIGRPAC